MIAELLYDAVKKDHDEYMVRARQAAADELEHMTKSQLVARIKTLADKVRIVQNVNMKMHSVTLREIALDLTYLAEGFTYKKEDEVQT